MVNVGSISVGCRVTQIKLEKARFELLRPVCACIGDKVALSRRVEKHWRLIGWAEITKGKIIEPTYG